MQSTNDLELSISDKALSGVGVLENLVLFQEHGFTHIHFSYKWKLPERLSADELTGFQEKLAAANLRVLDVHGCHPPGQSIASEISQDREAALDLFRHRLEVTHALGGDAMVYHVPQYAADNAVMERYVDSLQRLEDFTRSLGIMVALENHYIAEDDKIALARCFEQFDSSYIGFTLDPGHGSKSGNLPWLLDNCMDRLAVLHLNDNDGISDKHWVPCQAGGTVDWQAVVAGIARSPYRKPLQLEIFWREDKHPSRTYFLTEAARVGRSLHEEICRLRETTQATTRYGRF